MTYMEDIDTISEHIEQLVGTYASDLISGDPLSSTVAGTGLKFLTVGDLALLWSRWGVRLSDIYDVIETLDDMEETITTARTCSVLRHMICQSQVYDRMRHGTHSGWDDDDERALFELHCLLAHDDAPANRSAVDWIVTSGETELVTTSDGHQLDVWVGDGPRVLEFTSIDDATDAFHMTDCRLEWMCRRLTEARSGQAPRLTRRFRAVLTERTCECSGMARVGVHEREIMSTQFDIRNSPASMRLMSQIISGENC